MDRTYILSLVTIVVSLILGNIAKKVSYINNNLILLQNLLVGLIIAIIDWIIYKDFKMAIMVSSLTAGGIYDIVNNLLKMKKTR